MDKKDKKAGMKRKSKAVDPLLGIEDDELIGSLLKKKGKKSFKKSKIAGEGRVAEVRAADVKDDGLGEMDDTLANFRKKLRAPKNNGSAAAKHEKCLSKDSLSLPSKSLGELIKPLDRDLMPQGQGGVLNDEGGKCGDLIPAESLQVKDTKKDKISKANSDAMIIESKSNGDLDSTSTGGDALQNQKDTSKPDDKSSEDSLSVFFLKVQSEMSGKCLRSKLVKENQISEDASKKDLSAVSEARVDVFEPCSQLLDRPLEPNENGHADPVQVSINSSLICPGVNDCLTACSCKIAGDVESVIKSGAVGNSSQNNEVFLMEVKGSGPSTSISKDVQENLDIEKLECGVNNESGLRRTAELEHPSSPSVVNNQQCGSVTVLDTCFEERIQAPISSQDMEDLSSKYRSSPVSVSENLKCEEAKSTKNEDVSVQVGNGSNNVMQPSHQLEDACRPRSEYASEDEALNVKSHSSTMLDHQASCPEDVESPSDLEIKGNGQNQRASRVARRHRHVDMAYEGDVDWEILMQEQELFSIHQNTDKTKDKFNSVTSVTDAENRKMAAVSVGLKARAVTPMEKIKFKEVLKHKGGLQEYLECRNYILSLWNKDVSRILPLSDFGVSANPLDDESPRTSLIRDTFNFLDQRGYINFGVPSRKDKVENCIKDDLKLQADEKCVENSRRSLVDLDDHVPLTMGKETNLEHCVTEKSDHAFDAGEQAAKSISDDGPLDPETPASAATIAPEVCPADGTLEIKCHDPETPGEAVNIDNLDSKPCFMDEDERMAPAISLGMPPVEEAVSDVTSEPIKPVSALISAPEKFSERDTKFDSGPRKSVIIVGAGPAGLTAARHMQRQGVDVTVLEARNRIGGRVFTDRSSLSVPVDLGASIITGVEADVATERRPDPSALICGQLGLEMTVLNSDCPLYDTVTGQKVPADLDEALEAEYNNLLDEMELLVAEKGQRAMKMSLEEGLELGLKRHRLPQSGQDAGDIRPVKSADSLAQAETVCVDNEFPDAMNFKAEVLSPPERRVMDWHFAHLEYGCASMLKEVSLVDWNQDDIYGGFGGAHCMIKGGYSALVESLGEGLCIHFDHVVTEIEYNMDSERNGEMHKKVKVCTSNGREFYGDAVLVTVPLGCLKAETIKFSPSLPEWKHSSIKRLGFGVLNKVILEFPEVFWDDTIDYFGATAEDSDKRGRCFMFWNIKKTVGAPVLIALLVGKAAIDGQSINSADHVNHALFVLRKLFGEDKVCDPVASVVTEWGRDPYSYGAYSYVAVGSSGEDYDIIGRPVENCLFFAGEATCKEHPDTVGGAMMSGLREAVRIIDIFDTGIDYTAEVEAMEAAKRHFDLARSEVKDIIRRLDAVEFSTVSFKKSLDRSQISAWSSMIKDMFFTAKTIAGRLHLAKELLHLPVGFLKSFASTKQGLSTLNSWILDSLGKDGTQLLRHCVRLLVRVSNDLVSVRLSGIGKTVREKVCVHTSRDIRAIASQLVHVWVELFRKEKAMKATKRRLTHKQASPAAGRPPLGTHIVDSTESSKSSGSSGHQKLSSEIPMTEEEKAAFAAAEAAHAAAIAAAEAYAASGAMHNASLQAPKILSFQKFTMREQSTYMDDTDYRKNWSGAPIIGQDCLAEIDSRNCRVRDWSVDFAAAGINLENSKISIDNHSQRSHHSNDIADNQMNMKFREHCEENLAFDSSILTKAWVDSAGSMGLKDYSAIERWQCQAMAASSQFPPRTTQVRDEENSTSSAKVNERQHYTRAKESAATRPTVSKESKGNQRRGPASIKEAVVDYVASLLMPLYKAKKLDRDDYKSIMKKTATKVMEHATDTEKAMAVYQFLDFKRKNKIRDFVDVLIERHMGRKQDPKPGNSGRL